jgi:hypothetical protein
MKDLHTLLTGADPVTEKPELSPDEALAMRRVVLSAARTARPARDPWSGALPVAAVVVVTIAAGVALGRKLPAGTESAGMSTHVLAAPSERRQMQFATPGGTRIIWTLDPEFELRGSTP